MTFAEYVAACTQLLKEHPEAANFRVIYAKDAEGNGYEQVSYIPALGYMEAAHGGFGDWVPLSSILEEPEEYDYTAADVNSVCIN